MKLELLLAQMNTAQHAVLTTLIGLLISKGVITAEEAKTRYENLLGEIGKSDAGEVGLALVRSVLVYLEGVKPSEDPPSRH